MYCAKFYGRGFIRGYEDESPVIKLCTIHNYTVICLNPPFSSVTIVTYICYCHTNNYNELQTIYVDTII